MARFRGAMVGQRGEVSRLGSARSGFDADIRGWDVGVMVRAKVIDDDKDEIRVYKTAGSNALAELDLVCTVHQDGSITFPNGKVLVDREDLIF